jgi:hypothetical protein
MTYLQTTKCDFQATLSQDGMHRLITIQPHEPMGLLDGGETLSFELDPEFETGDAEHLVVMLKKWITNIRFDQAN